MLAELNDLKTYLGMSLGDTTYDTRLTAVLGAADAAVKTFCGRTFDGATFTEQFAFDFPTDSFQVAEYPISGTVALTVGDTLWTENTDFWLNRQSGIFRALQDSFVAGDTLQVTYYAGYTGSSVVPKDLQFGVLEQAAWSYEQAGKGWMKSERLGDRQYTIDSPGDQSVLIPAAAKWVQNYVKPLFSL